MTWNLHYYPASDRADDVVVAELARLAPDVVGVEEVKALFDGFDATRPGEADQTAR